MKFPLYKNDGDALFELTGLQFQAVKNLKNKINSGTYKRTKNRCFCESAENDGLLIAEKDMFGLPLKSILCSKSGLICSDYIFDEKSNNEFYLNEYRDLASFGISISDYFDSQIDRGTNFYNLFQENAPSASNLEVVEIGCGAGGVLYPFLKNENKCTGFDYNKDYLEYGKTKGLDLRWGDYRNTIKNDSVDIMILSHVMEHFLCPVQEIQNIIEKIKPNKYLIIEVPGIYFKYKKIDTPMKYLQISHVVNYFHKDFLKFLFKQLGMEILYGDDRCTFILKKDSAWKRVNNVCIPDKLFEENREVIKDYIIKTHTSYNQHWENVILEILNFLHLKRFAKEIYMKFLNKVKPSSK